MTTRRTTDGDERIARSDLLWAGAFGGAAMLLAAVLARLVFGGMPHVQDSIAQLFQARIFAHGRLWAASPPVAGFFDYAQMINDGRWYSQYPPGHSLLLVPGVWLGVPWLINPILGGLAVFATSLLARQLFDPLTARLAGALGLLSPFLIFMASEFMSHVSALCLITFFLLFYFRLVQRARMRDGVLAGLCLGYAVLIRPYTAFAMAVPAGLQMLWLLYKHRIGNIRPVLALAAGGLLGVVLLLLYNGSTTGDPLLPGYIKLYGSSHRLGFGTGSWGPPHTFLRGLRIAWSTLVSLNGRLFEWPLTSLWPLVLALVPWSGVGRRDLSVRWFLASFPICLVAAYVFYWYHDLCFGPRFVYEALGPILVLTGLGFRQVGIQFAGMRARPARESRKSAAGEAWPAIALIAILTLVAGFAGWPKLFRPAHAAGDTGPGTPGRMGSYFQGYAPEFWGVSPYLHHLVEQQGLDHALVFVRLREEEIDRVYLQRLSDRERLPHLNLWFGSAFAWEDPDLAKAKVVYAHDRGSDNARLAALFPDRRIYLYTGNIEQGILSRIPELERGHP